MVKECEVVSNNAATTVVLFGKTKIQFPSIGKDKNKVFVEFKNGIYSIVDKTEMSSKHNKLNEQQDIDVEAKNNDVQ